MQNSFIKEFESYLQKRMFDDWNSWNTFERCQQPLSLLCIVYNQSVS